jgi:hypothetical protein
MDRYAGALPRFLFAAFAALIASTPIAMAQTADGEPPRVGGGCDYVEIPGVATIEGVEKTPEASEQATAGGGPGYEGLEIRYTFAPSEPVDDPQIKAWVGEMHILQLANSWYPGPRYVEKYGLAEGKTLDAVLKALTAGTCTPFVVDFPDLDLTDYFETAVLIRPSAVLAELR